MNDSARQPIYELGDFRLDAHRRVLLDHAGQPVSLTPRLMDLLVYLVERPGRLLSKEELLKAIWPRVVVEEHNLNKAISELRRVLGEKRGEHRFIVTNPGRGYRFVADVSIVPPLHARTISETAALDEPRASTALWRSGQLRLIGSIGAVVLLLGAVAFAVLDPVAPNPGRGMRVRPLSVEKDGGEIPHVTGSTVWKPDGLAIAYAQTNRDRLTPPEPFVLYLNGSSPMSLTGRPGGLPKQWTRAGHIVLNTSKGPNVFSESAGLWTVPAVGGEAERLFTPPPGTTNVLSVSADGATVAALRRDEDGVWGIWTGSIESGTLERYEPAPFAATQFGNYPTLAFSPDGQRLLFMWLPIGGAEQSWLLPYPPDPMNPPRRVLESLPTYLGTPLFSWMPDNRHIVVSTGERGKPHRLYLADTESGRFRLLSDETSPAKQLGPVVSPDGTRLVFTEDASHLDVVTLNVLTAAVSRPIATNRNEEMPAWSADGKRLVYVTDRNGEAEIWLREEDGTHRPVVTPRDFPNGTTRYFFAPELSPDGSRVMYGRLQNDLRGATVTQVWMSSLAGGAPMRLRESVSDEHVGSWSPDGAWYAYLEAFPDGTHALKKARTSGTSAPQTLAMTGDHPSRSVPVWSPDGRWILADDDGLKLISADGSETRDLGLSGALCTFARTPETFYCIDNVSNVGARTLVVRQLDGSTQVVATLPVEAWPVASGGPALRLSLAPDGESVTYSAGTPRRQMLLLEGLADVPLP